VWSNRKKKLIKKGILKKWFDQVVRSDEDIRQKIVKNHKNNQTFRITMTQIVVIIYNV
jgi:hypothetical protein